MMSNDGAYPLTADGSSVSAMLPESNRPLLESHAAMRSLGGGFIPQRRCGRKSAVVDWWESDPQLISESHQVTCAGPAWRNEFCSKANEPLLNPDSAPSPPKTSRQQKIHHGTSVGPRSACRSLAKIIVSAGGYFVISPTTTTSIGGGAVVSRLSFFIVVLFSLSPRLHLHP